MIDEGLIKRAGASVEIVGTSMSERELQGLWPRLTFLRQPVQKWERESRSRVLKKDRNIFEPSKAELVGVWAGARKGPANSQLAGVRVDLLLFGWVVEGAHSEDTRVFGLGSKGRFVKDPGKGIVNTPKTKVLLDTISGLGDYLTEFWEGDTSQKVRAMVDRQKRDGALKLWSR
jgi:hypothetical protein